MQDSKHDDTFVGDNGGGDGADTVEGLLELNKLNYDMFPDLSVAVARTTKQQQFQQRNYSSESRNAVCTFNTGSDYINGKESYLAFTLRYTTTANGNGGPTDIPPTRPDTFTFGHRGSALNLIQDIVIQDRAGNELERVTGVNIIANMRQWLMSPGWRRTNGLMFGCYIPAAPGQASPDPDEILPGFNNTAGTPIVHAGSRFAIPLFLISGLFDINKLLPSTLMTGLQIQITFAAPETVFVQDSGSAAGLRYALDDVRFELDAHTLSDSVNRTLMQRSATDGLEIPFRTWHLASTNLAAAVGTDISAENRKAVSRAFKSRALFRVTTNITDVDEDSFAAVDSNISQWQWQVGNMYYPHQPRTVGGDDVGLYAETFHAISKSEGLIDSAREGAMYPDDFQTNGAVPPLWWIPLDLERSSAIDVSGLPLNNSRILQLQAKFKAGSNQATGGGQTVTLCLQYFKVLRSFVDNTSVEE
jgi:hypothetical protein